MQQLTAGPGRILLTAGCRRYGLNYHWVYPKLFGEIEAVDGRLVVSEESLQRLSRQREDRFSPQPAPEKARA